MKILTLNILESNEQQECNLYSKKSYCSPGGTHLSVRPPREYQNFYYSPGGKYWSVRPPGEYQNFYYSPGGTHWSVRPPGEY